MDEVLSLLAPQPGETLIDCTLGGGGHAIEIARRLGPSGLVIGCDVDGTSLEAAEARFANMEGELARLETSHGSFLRLPQILRHRELQADMLLADLGFNSTQMDDPTRGLSFSREGPLDMRLDPTTPTTAADLIAQLSEGELSDLIFEYGEEPLARKIARNLVRQRRVQPIQSTLQLARLVEQAYGPRARSSRMHPATRTFMALRIAVNDELTALQGLLDELALSAGEAQGWLGTGARVGIICFHSLEDRRVKHAFASMAERGKVEILTSRPVVAKENEVRENPRSRSAKLRVVRMTAPNQRIVG